MICMADNTLLGNIRKATLAMREDEKQQFSTSAAEVDATQLIFIDSNRNSYFFN